MFVLVMELNNNNECNPKLFVSRGIGTSGVPMRFMSLPEIAFFEMEIV